MRKPATEVRRRWKAARESKYGLVRATLGARHPTPRRANAGRAATWTPVAGPFRAGWGPRLHMPAKGYKAVVRRRPHTCPVFVHHCPSNQPPHYHGRYQGKSFCQHVHASLVYRAPPLPDAVPTAVQSEWEAGLQSLKNPALKVRAGRPHPLSPPLHESSWPAYAPPASWTYLPAAAGGRWCCRGALQCPTPLTLGITCHVLAADPVLQAAIRCMCGPGRGVRAGLGGGWVWVGPAAAGGLGFFHSSTHPAGARSPLLRRRCSSVWPTRMGSSPSSYRHAPGCPRVRGQGGDAIACQALPTARPARSLAAANLRRGGGRRVHGKGGAGNECSFQLLPQISSPILHRPRPPIHDTHKPTHPPNPTPPLTRRR